MKFLCLCMSPALDATVELPSAPSGAGEIFKDVRETETAGGKGLNVARWLALRGAEVACAGLLGEDNARPFEREMAKFRIRDLFRRVPGTTRRNEMIVWPNGSVKLNRSAFASLRAVPAPADMLAEVDAQTVCILSGSLPACCDAGYYAACVAYARARGATVALDASGPPLRKGVEAHPDVVKPNADECRQLVGFAPKTADDFRRATEILKPRVGTAVISDGGAGCWFNGRFVAAPPVDVLDTTAAGDTLLAEWCWRTYGEAAGEDAGRWAVAAGSAACAMPGGEPPDPARVAFLATKTGR
ncbi:MAG: 1-phosphofructokinase family hexose kinase [Kiritimatiellia bacterium]